MMRDLLMKQTYMIKKSCLLLVNSALLLTGSTQGFLPVTQDVEFDTNALQASEVKDFTKEEKGLRDQVFTERIAQIFTPINLEYNEYVKKHILRLLENKKQCAKLVERSQRYFPIFNQVFERNNIPEAINSLAVIESHLIVDAKSPVGAYGLWQFMPETAKHLGLQVNESIDERLDVFASTEKAAKYLNQLYKRYDDWLLALAAYNCGPGNVNKAIRRSGGKNTFWEIIKYLPKETQNYVPKFIATVYLMNFHAEHDIAPQYKKAPQEITSIKVSSAKEIMDLVAYKNIELIELKSLNKSIRNWDFDNLETPINLHIPFSESEDYLLSDFNTDIVETKTESMNVQYSQFDVLFTLS